MIDFSKKGCVFLKSIYKIDDMEKIYQTICHKIKKGLATN